MRLDLRTAMPWAGLAAIALLLGACAGKREALRPLAASSSAKYAAPPSEAVWHLRAGLNVAALSCRGRGRTSVVGAYSRMLKRHSILLAQSYAAEQRRHGASLDRHQTQLYNRFSNQRSPERFLPQCLGSCEPGQYDGFAQRFGQCRAVSERALGAIPES